MALGNNPLQQVIGREVKINRGGPDSLTGRLLSVQRDIIVLLTREGVVYVNAIHVKSISLTNSSGKSGNRSNRSNTSNRSNRSNRDPGFITAHSFMMLLHLLNRQFVQINRGGPEKIEGFIVEVDHNFVTLVVKKEVIRVPLFHIKSINVANRSKGNQSGSNQNKSGKSNNQNKSNSSNRNNSKSNSKNNKSPSQSGNKSR